MVTYVMTCPKCGWGTAVPAFVGFPFDLYRCKACHASLLWDLTMRDCTSAISADTPTRDPDSEAAAARRSPAKAGREGGRATPRR